MSRHAQEAIRLIDQTLLEEEGKLAELHEIVEQNGSEFSEEQLVFGWFHDSHLDA